ncbi:MAG: DNA polymerase III subunit alpha [Planctomycetes bacterium]|nr:DNA polymerase III subunit alpha [Planctomycetota bacterium]
MPADFVHLQTHSHYSLLASTIPVEDLVSAAKADEQSALALTDSGNLFGAIEFYKACTAAGIKPILGMTAYVAGKSRLERSTGSENPTHQITLLAADTTGWHNLRRLATLGYLEGFYYRPRIDREALARHAEGLIALSGPLQSPIHQRLLAGDEDGAMRVAGEYAELFAGDRFHLQVMDTGSDVQRRCGEGVLRIAQRTGLPVVATHEVRYLEPQDAIALDILMCIGNGSVISDPNRFRMPSREFYLKSRAEMHSAFAHLPNALANSVAIAERCTVPMDFHVYHVPVFQTGTGEPPERMFQRLCREGAKHRYGEYGKDIADRLEYEIGVVQKLGFVSYFLIVWDFIRQAKDMGIPVGPGRGSAAGSVVAYCLGITDVDPMRYRLLFERFLNPERVSMPDIDVDFCGNRRDEIIQYVRAKYGAESVCQIITFGTMASRGVLRDVGRVLEIPLAEVDKIAKKVPQGPGASLAKAVETDKELVAIRDASPENQRLFQIGLKLEGLVRHSSIHAAGVVIADRPLVEYVPLCKNGDDVVTQWQMTELEEVGLLKMDFLGLKTLTILAEACRLIERTQGVRLDLGQLPLDDAETYRLMTRGETLGVFQLESTGMRELLGRLKPDKFEDVIAVLALYRPGPLGSGMVDMFVRRKHGEEPVVYPHESLRGLLEETYGVIVYQEQVMLIANELAGFALSEADALRKAMGKKKPEVMAKFKDKFVEGAARKGHDRTFARELFETMEYFAGYGFNKSHSTAYALLTYQTAWLKAHHPVEFLAANLTVESGNSDKAREFVDEARRMQVMVLPPDVNHSYAFFQVEDGGVRFGLGAVKGIGTKAAESIASERERGGPYRSQEDLCERLDSHSLNKTALEALAKAGAFDGLGSTRRAAFEAIDLAMRHSASARADRRKGQKLLFGAGTGGADEDATRPPAPPPVDPGEWDEKTRLAHEKEALGFYLSGHPFERRGRFLQRLAGQTSAGLPAVPPGTNVRLAGMVTGVRILQVKSGRSAGQKMARFQLQDLHGTVAVTCFARVYEQVKARILEDAIVFVRGRVDAQGEDCALLLDEILPAQEVVDREVDALVVRMTAAQVSEEGLERIREAAESCRGDQRLLFEVDDGDGTYRIRADRRYSVRIGDEVLDRMADLVGPANLSFTRR